MNISKIFWLGAVTMAFVTAVPVQAADHDGHNDADMMKGRMGMMQGGMGMMGKANAKLTREQFMQQAEARFARMDDNKDGVIDASDREKMHERMRDCMGMMDMMGGMADDKKGMKSQH